MKTRVEGNPYLDARRNWDERYGSILSAAKRWRIESAGLMVLCLVLACACVVLANQRKFTAWIVETDGTRVLASGPATRVAEPSQDLIREAMREWVKHWRLVTTDPQVQTEAIEWVYNRTDKGSPAIGELASFYDPAKGGVHPFDRAKEGTVQVQTESALPTTPGVYEVRWAEVERDTAGEVKQTTHWVASLAIVINPPKDPDMAKRNGLGVYVTNVTSEKVGGTSK